MAPITIITNKYQQKPGSHKTAQQTKDDAVCSCVAYYSTSSLFSEKLMWHQVLLLHVQHEPGLHTTATGTKDASVQFRFLQYPISHKTNLAPKCFSILVTNTAQQYTNKNTTPAVTSHTATGTKGDFVCCVEVRFTPVAGFPRNFPRNPAHGLKRHGKSKRVGHHVLVTAVHERQQNPR